MAKITLTDAKSQVTTMLTMATPDQIYVSLSKARRVTRERVIARVRATADVTVFESSEEDYALLFLALADLTGEASYRL